MSATVKLVSINIEGSKHLPLVAPFLTKEDPDVVCMQEIVEADIPFFEQTLQMRCVFGYMNTQVGSQGRRVLGVGIFTRLPVKDSCIEYYVDHRAAGDFNVESFETKYATESFVLVSVTIEKDGVPYTFVTTHMPVTEEAQVTDFQREAFASMLKRLSSRKSFVLCGDFNTPRGDELFAQLSERYTDNVPTLYTTSLDPIIHRAGPLGHMVDGMFSTKDFTLNEVEMRCGVSDHCALVGTVSRT